MNQTMISPSGPTKTWRLWRHCCCRYGLYPLLIVPIVTLGCLLTIFSSVGCKFVEIDIGFEPVNEGWNATAPYNFGLFFYHNATIKHDNLHQNMFHSGCTKYSNTFYDSFIGSDRTFKMTQIMAMISCVSSALSMVSLKNENNGAQIMKTPMLSSFNQLNERHSHRF